MQNKSRSLVTLVTLGSLLLLGHIPRARASDTPAPSADKLAVGSTRESLTVGPATYRNVRIRSVSAQTAMIQHDAGITSLRLRDLSPELQQRFGYNPDAAAAEAEKQKAAAASAAQQRRQEMLPAATKARAIPKPAAPAREESKLDRLLLSFGQPSEVQPAVDLRSRYNELGLWVKNQGARPSCAVFAIVSALEFQSAELSGNPTRFSEEYLLWATRKTLNRAPRSQATAATSGDMKETDEGFALQEVVTALRSYGIPQRERVPNRFSDAVDTIDPDEAVIGEARASRRVFVHNLPGRDGPTRVSNLIHALNAGIPVPVGLAWPIEYNRRTGYLDNQRTYADKGHAVTIVGYKSPTGRIEDAVFTFKNSWGPNWGVDGYGNATYAFLSSHLHSAVILEVQPE